MSVPCSSEGRHPPFGLLCVIWRDKSVSAITTISTPYNRLSSAEEICNTQPVQVNRRCASQHWIWPRFCFCFKYNLSFCSGFSVEGSQNKERTPSPSDGLVYLEHEIKGVSCVRLGDYGGAWGHRAHLKYVRIHYRAQNTTHGTVAAISLIYTNK